MARISQTIVLERRVLKDTGVTAQVVAQLVRIFQILLVKVLAIFVNLGFTVRKIQGDRQNVMMVIIMGKLVNPHVFYVLQDIIVKRLVLYHLSALQVITAH